MYEYQSRPLNIVDGDTFDVTIDLGFRIHREIRLRLAGIDTHEIHGVETDSEEYLKGIIEKKFVEEWFQKAGMGSKEWPIIIRSERTGKFGRYIAEVERKSDGAVLNEDLITEFGKEIRYPKLTLLSLTGLGPVRKKRLNEANVFNLDDLVRYEPKQLAEIGGVNIDMASLWITEANEMLSL